MNISYSASTVTLVFTYKSHQNKVLLSYDKHIKIHHIAPFVCEVMRTGSLKNFRWNMVLAFIFVSFKFLLSPPFMCLLFGLEVGKCGQGEVNGLELL